MGEDKREYYSYAIVTERDPLSGEPERFCVGYDGPDYQRAATARAERIAAENRANPLVIDAVAVVEQVEEG